MKGKSTFIFSEDQKVYTVQLKKVFRWWYLLPLLLLLLLIKCNTAIQYQTIDAETKEPVENAEINVGISSLSYSETQTTDEDGKTTFNVGKYPIYKIIFSPVDGDVKTVASHQDYVTKIIESTLKPLSKGLNIIELEKVKAPQIVIVDSLTREPLQGIEVTLTRGTQTQTEISDADGNVFFDNITIDDSTEIIISTQSPDYEDVRKYYHIEPPQTLHDTIALLSFEDGGLRGERGDITVNLAWGTVDDLDLMLFDPCKNQVYFKERKHTCGDGEGFLDLDANASDDSVMTNPQENIFWNNPSPGNYLVYVYFYKRREPGDIPFKVTLMLKNKRKIIDSVATQAEKFILIDTIKIEDNSL